MTSLAKNLLCDPTATNYRRKGVLFAATCVISVEEMEKPSLTATALNMKTQVHNTSIDEKSRTVRAMSKKLSMFHRR